MDTLVGILYKQSVTFLWKATLAAFLQAVSDVVWMATIVARSSLPPNNNNCLADQRGLFWASHFISNCWCLADRLLAGLGQS
jgi:hypothetical protein